MFGRTRNAKRNILAGIGDKIIHLIFPFIIRSVTIQVLGAEYLGLGSLFTSILQVLNLAELGFSSAVIYNMYKPLAENDTKTVCALLNFYKKIYRIIGAVILGVGLAVLPFLRNLIDGGIPDNINLYILYLLFLFNTVSTYFLFAYKSALLNACQRNDVVSIVHAATSLIQFLAQILVLIATGNYYLFIIVQCITGILNNLLTAYIAKLKYPQCVCAGEVPKEQRKDIRRRVYGLMVYKICSTTRNSFDSIFISSMVGLTAVAIYSNYYTIMTAIIGVMGIFTSSIISSVGNSIVTESEEKNYRDMNKINFLYMWFSGWLAICLACLYQPLMKLWMGEENMFPFGIVILFCIYFYALKMGDIRAVYSDAKGLWYENRFRTIAESITNVALNAVLGYFFGVSGIIIATLVSLIVFGFAYSAQILFKHYFVHFKVSRFYLQHLMYALVTVAIGGITYLLCSLIPLEGVIGLVAKALVCVGLPNLGYLLVYRNTKIYKEAAGFVKNILPKSVFRKK